MEGKTLGTGTAKTLYLKVKKDKKNLKHLKSSKITEGPALSIVDHSTHTHTHTPIHPYTYPLYSLYCPLHKTDVAFIRKLEEEEATAALNVRVILVLSSSQADFCSSTDPLFNL